MLYKRKVDITPERIAIARLIATRGRAWGIEIAKSLSLSEEAFWDAINCRYFTIEIGGYDFSRYGRAKLASILSPENTTSNVG